MSDLIEQGRDKLHDPLLMSWALRCYGNAKRQGPEQSLPLEDAWFDDLTLARWIEAGDHAVLTELFDTLPSRRFANLKPAIIERWPSWSGRLGARATFVLLDSPIAVVRPLFARHIKDNLRDTEKTLAVIAAIPDLPQADAVALLNDVTRQVLDLDGGGNWAVIKRQLLRALLQPTAALNPDALLPLIETCVRPGLDRDQTERLLDAVCCTLFGSAAVMEHAESLLAGDLRRPFSSLHPLFIADAPLAACDHILSDAVSGDGARALIEQHAAASSATGRALAVLDILQAAARAADEEPDGDWDDELDDDSACFAIAAVLGAFERTDIDPGSLTMDEALDLLALDLSGGLSGKRHVPQLARHLATFAPADVARAVTGRMPVVREGWGGVHLAELAGELRLEGAISCLIDCLGRDRSDYLCEAAQTALVRIGPSAQRALIAQWDALDASQRIYGLTALEQIGGEPACQFALDRFDELFRSDADHWCALAMAVPDQRLIARLEPEVRRKQPQIDECFYVLCTLAGRQPDADDGRLDEIRARITARDQFQIQRQAELSAGHIHPQDTVRLALKCEICGDVNRYEIKSVVTGKMPETATEAGAAPYFVGDDVACASCGAWPDFEFTTDAHMQVMAALILTSLDTSADRHKSPLRLMDVTYRWEKRSAPDVMAELKSAVARHPRDIVNQLRMGRFQYRIGRCGRAADAYTRAIKIEPDAMEAGLGLAHVMADGGDGQGAFNRLSRMLEQKNRWRFFREDELSAKGLTEDFAKLFNKLRPKLGQGRPLLAAALLSAPVKVGRNDPCPCGSGQKHKKCCASKPPVH